LNLNLTARDDPAFLRGRNFKNMITACIIGTTISIIYTFIVAVYMPKE